MYEENVFFDLLGTNLLQQTVYYKKVRAITLLLQLILLI